MLVFRRSFENFSILNSFFIYIQVLKKNLSADALKFSIVEKKDEGKQVNNELIWQRQNTTW